MPLLLNTENVRELLGIVYCPKCRQDTMPSDRTGQCFFCDRKLVEPKPDTPGEAAAVFCEFCDDEITDPAAIKRVVTHGKRFCSTRCRKAAWHLTPAGLAWRDEKVRRRTIAKRNERAAKRKASEQYRADLGTAA